tara:strand:- start:399 stop:605 length:207 start_codon:yes stop_codon:yes gene_type:complete
MSKKENTTYAVVAISWKSSYEVGYLQHSSNNLFNNIKDANTVCEKLSADDFKKSLGQSFMVVEIPLRK